MTKRLEEVQEILDLAGEEQVKFFFIDEEEEEDKDKDRGGKADA